MKSRPFGEASLDDWLHWVISETPDEIAVRFRGEWYTVSFTMWGYAADKVKGHKRKKGYAALPTVRYAELPPHFQLDVDKWRWRLRDAFAGLEGIREVGSGSS